MNFPKQLQAWCDSALAQLAETATKTSGLAVVTVDGFVVSSMLADKDKASRIAAMASSLFALGDAVVEEQAIGPYKHLLIDAGGGKIVLTAFNLREHLLLLVQFGKEDCMLGSLLMNARLFAERALTAQT
jgi:predicted regulator of Ras-like GTPase activity (Roadblock/LC7/MglB family)